MSKYTNTERGLVIIPKGKEASTEIGGGKSASLTADQLKLSGTKALIAEGRLKLSGTADAETAAPDAETAAPDAETAAPDAETAAPVPLTDEQIAALSPAEKRKRTMALKAAEAGGLPPAG